MEGPNFASVYNDDLLVYSKTLDGHLYHLSRVMDRLRDVNLKLQPTKCYFCSQTVECPLRLIPGACPHSTRPFA